MNITLDVIPHETQRYPTVGDWQWEGDTLKIRVSAMGNQQYETLVGIHEMIEALRCLQWGVDPLKVDAFDIAYEEARKANQELAPCGCEFMDEPGDDIHAPYHVPHQEATTIERVLATFWGVKWHEYEAAIEAL
jgi:hypothetical protein